MFFCAPQANKIGAFWNFKRNPLVCPGYATRGFLNFNTPDSCYFTFTGITTNERTVREQSAAGDFYFKPLQFSAIM